MSGPENIEVEVACPWETLHPGVISAMDKQKEIVAERFGLAGRPLTSSITFLSLKVLRLHCGLLAETVERDTI